MDWKRFRYVSFDCYGTLIDWEAGILEGIRRALANHGVRLVDPWNAMKDPDPDAISIDLDSRDKHSGDKDSDHKDSDHKDSDRGLLRGTSSGDRVLHAEDALRRYAGLEAELEAGSYRRYREVLFEIMLRLGRDLGVQLTREEASCLPDSVPDWVPFSDTVDALASLRSRYELVILSNIDDAFFAGSARHLQTDFAEVVTAEQVGSYKPALAHFREAQRRLDFQPDEILHVAQSVYHDHVPAGELGWSSVWVNRRSRCPGTGVTLEVGVRPAHEVPDLAGLVRLLGLS